MKRSEGYIYFELLASFFVCCFIAFSILPIFIKMETDRQNVRLRMEAKHLLYLELEGYMRQEFIFDQKTITKNSREYQMVWRSADPSIKFMEGCVRYRNAVDKEVEVCDYVTRY
ncbi:hypothetical protein [Peribacillus sp. SCS-155]|uniref:hypothetical protein n=1 Tax=Peribacillus sedimenti TaxID=3115297 RepID=UPI0039067A23